MRRLFIAQAFLAVLLLFLVAVHGSRVMEAHVGPRLRLGGPSSVGLKAETIEYLRALRGRVALTYFASARAIMPSSMKGVEDSVRSLLAAIKRAAPEKLDYRVLDPDLDGFKNPEPEKEKQGPGAAYASGKSASPMKVRKVLRDESSEELVWSSLVLQHDAHTDALIPGITPGDLPYLEDWIVENLKAAESPIQPVIAVAAPSRGFQTVRELVKNLTGDPSRGIVGARVVAADIDGGAGIPPEADLLIWIDPGRATREHAAALERFLATGRSVILAGSAYAVEYLPVEGGKLSCRISPSPCDWKALLQPFGLELAPLLVLDKNHEAIAWRQPDGSTRNVDAPFHLRILPTLFDTRSLLGPNAGALLVSAVSPIEVEPRAVAASGRRVEVVATTSEHARVLDLPAGKFDEASLESARPVPKQPWMALLKPTDSWRGDFLVAGSSTLFHDDPYAQGGNANQVFLRTLLRTYTHGPRLARIRVPRPEPPRLPPLSLASRVAWRAAAVFAVPVILLLVAVRTGRARRRDPARLSWMKPAAAGLLAFAALLVVAAAWRSWADFVVDLTDDGINTPLPLTSRLLEGSRAGLEAELLMSESAHLPPALKRLEPRVRSTLRVLGIRPRITRPEDLPQGEREKLQAAGIEPFDVETIEDDVPVTTTVWSSLRLRRGERTEVIPRLDARAVEHVEFLLAAAAKRLQGAPAPRLGVFSDLPRLSPGEAHSDYQQKGYTAPVGSDVYSASKDLLVQRGYEVIYINPDTPVLPASMDVLVWLQPRFPQRAYPQFVKYMAEGGKALIAVQHYNVQQQQHRGRGFKTAYWPQPQFHGFNDYLKLIGARQVGDKQGEQPGEVLFDRSHSSLVLDTQVNRSAFREHDPQQVSRPFLIRVTAEGLSSGSVITSRLSQLLFIWGSRFALEEDRLSRLGITSAVLVTTSPRCWSYAWSGGYIPDQTFIEPETTTLGRQPLAALLEGPFPTVDIKKDESQRDVMTVAERPGSASRPGKLLLIGCSEMFKNAHIASAAYQHDQFLLNAVAYLAHGPELAEVQARRRVPKTIPFQPLEVILKWRLVAVGLAPLLFVACGRLWRSLRRPVLRR